MAIKASATITLFDIVEIDSVTIYYLLQSSTSAAPAKPTTDNPGGNWSTTEPTYTEGSTNTLYTVTKTKYSDGTFEYTPVSKSSSYEAAKIAYNKAVAAKNSADGANDKINNLEIGGRNLLLDSAFPVGTVKWSRNTVDTDVRYMNNNSMRLKLSGNQRLDVPGQYFAPYITGKQLFLTFYIMCPDVSKLTTGINSWIGFRKTGYAANGAIQRIIQPSELTDNVWKKITITGSSSDISNIYCTMMIEPHNPDIDIYIACPKLEYGSKPTDWTPAPEDIEDRVDGVNNDLTSFKETTFTSYKRDQEATDKGIKDRLSRTEVTVYGDPEDPNDPKALINHVQKVDNDINGAGGAIDRIEAAEDTIDGTGLNDYDQRIKITQRFLNVETDVESIKNIFKVTGGTNLVQNSVGYFADNNNKPTMWTIAANTIYTPFGYDADLTGITVSRGKLFCAKGSITTTNNNIVALLANKMMSISFKYKNGANATSKIKIFNGSVIYFEKTFSSSVNQWTDYTFNPDTDPVLANPTFLNTANSLQISIESSNSTNGNGFEISDLMLNYGDIKPWELSSNEVYGAMVKLSSLGIEVTATTANTKNFMTTDGILVYEYNPATDTIGNLITKITDNGTVTNKLESTGDIIERNLINTMIKDSSNNDVYVEYIR